MDIKKRKITEEVSVETQNIISSYEDIFVCLSRFLTDQNLLTLCLVSKKINHLVKNKSIFTKTYRLNYGILPFRNCIAKCENFEYNFDTNLSKNFKNLNYIKTNIVKNLPDSINSCCISPFSRVELDEQLKMVSTSKISYLKIDIRKTVIFNVNIEVLPKTLTELNIKGSYVKFFFPDSLKKFSISCDMIQYDTSENSWWFKNLEESKIEHLKLKKLNFYRFFPNLPQTLKTIKLYFLEREYPQTKLLLGHNLKKLENLEYVFIKESKYETVEYYKIKNSWFKKTHLGIERMHSKIFDF